MVKVSEKEADRIAQRRASQIERANSHKAAFDQIPDEMPLIAMYQVSDRLSGAAHMSDWEGGGDSDFQNDLGQWRDWSLETDASEVQALRRGLGTLSKNVAPLVSTDLPLDEARDFRAQDVTMGQVRGLDAENLRGIRGFDTYADYFSVVLGLGETGEE